MGEVARRIDFAEEGSSGGVSDGEPLRVVLRVRPSTDEEKLRGEEEAVTVDSEAGSLRLKCRDRIHHKGSVREHGEAQFQFSTIFGPSSSQRDIFETTTLPLVEKLFKGKDGLVFAYGTTNAGKTYTIQGRGNMKTGLIHHVCQEIFDTTSRTGKNSPANANLEHEVSISLLEIYNEKCYDLLGDNDSKKVVFPRIKEDGRGSVFVDGLKKQVVKSIEQVTHALTHGMKQRRVAETDSNERSSRSHAIFTFYLDQLVVRAEGVTELVKSSSLSVVDLAGAERAGRNQACNREKIRETSHINKSLMNLARCLEVLKENQKRQDGKKHLVPYRQSRLTRLFQPSLETGSAVMIANISPLLRDSDETIHALSCAALACQVHVGTNSLHSWNKENVLSARKTPGGNSMKCELTRERARSSQLEREVQRLQLALAKTESRICTMESEVREEAANEMEQALAYMETECARRLEEAAETSERRVEKRIELITQTARKKMLRRAHGYVDQAANTKYREWLDEEIDQRKFEEQLHQEERIELLDRIEELEIILKDCKCVKDLSAVIDEAST
uniref:Kinesin-like protein n=1 Tax=Rhodosorus marinus TaxID=101924 RepID=A0A7S3E9P1_9RHOD|mmetsp:Transcript_16687/g.68351  ORF Transcript_16687/g.68351 Transcript_16687/m.68351 type:complete len:562 (+) Transcript_16687:129-1814(+)